MTTIKDIAKAAGVAQGTVSNVLNGKGNVSSDIIRQVMDAASALGYVPMERAKLLRRRQCKRIHFHTFGAFDMLVDGEPVHFRSGKAKELMALCVYRDGRPVSIHEIVENLWGENADGTGYRRTIKELADTLRDYGAEEMFLRSRGSLRVRMDLADSDFQAFMSGDEDAICQFQGVFMQQDSWAEPMVCTLQEKKELMLARMGSLANGPLTDMTLRLSKRR